MLYLSYLFHNNRHLSIFSALSLSLSPFCIVPALNNLLKAKTLELDFVNFCRQFRSVSLALFVLTGREHVFHSLTFDMETLKAFEECTEYNFLTLLLKARFENYEFKAS